MTTSIRLEEGIYYDISHDVYHADPAREPSLSAGCAETIITTCPHRAWFGHTRLNPDAPKSKQTQSMIDGSALHRFLLGDGPEVKIVQCDDWKKKDAQEQRDAAIAAGEIPLTRPRADELQTMAAIFATQIADHGEAAEVLGNDYASEVTMIWREPTGALCRARPDRMHRTDQCAPIYDLKFTDKLQSPLTWDRSFISSFWDMRAAFYSRGAYFIRGKMPPYRYIVCEKEPPHDIMVLQSTPEMLVLGERKAEEAIRAWESCVLAGTWPRYPSRVFHISPPPWALANWDARPDIEHMLPAPPVGKHEAASRRYDLGGIDPEDILASG